MMKNGRVSLRLSGKLILFACFAGLFACEAKAARPMKKMEVMGYLKDYGYLPSDMRKPMKDKMMSKAISKFQSFIGMKPTGIMDAETTHMMQMPRCGIKDIFRSSTGRRSRRWAPFGGPWKNRKLTYRVTKYSDRRGPVNREDVDQLISKAFATWSEQVDLSFTPTSSKEVDIEIKFVRGYHGDGAPFDGPGHVLAHAFKPADGGDLHFDDDENWTRHKISSVGLHEMGHALGLQHSSVKRSIMFPYYDPKQTIFQLHKDDIEGIQAQYGKKKKTRGEDPDLCKDVRIDAIFDSPDGNIYAFKGKYYTRIMDDRISTGYPKLIDTKWRELPGNIDAALTYKNLTYFFKRSMVWTYNGDRMVKWPQKISKEFPGIPNDIDTVTIWTGDKKIYFYKGTKYWRFEPEQRPQVKSGYPRHISDWQGLPNKLDASVAYQGDNYFFAGDQYYRFDDRRSMVYPEGPQKTTPDLFGCHSANKTDTA